MAEESTSLRRGGVWGAVAFGVALAVVVGVRLDQAALAVVVGVVCGVGASIPTSLLIVSLMRRQDQKTWGERPRAVQSPPVVVVAPPHAPQLPQPVRWPEPVSAQRRFTV
ncbi:MAG: hypothetical protein PVF45_08360, partial [Anaerolineae bacterium]